MKLNTVALTLATAGLVAAQPHHHAHRHHQKRTPGTVIEYQLNGQQISVDDVCKGIADGTLKWENGQAPPDACQSSSSSSSTSTPAPTSTPSPTPTPDAGQFIQTPASSAESSTSEASSSSTQAASSSSSSSSSSSASSGSSSGSSGIDSDFPDGEIDCSTFPSDYGAVSLDYLGFGGWSGIQYVSGNLIEKVINDIVTAVSGDSCHGEAMCSYACPAGYQKSQWPSAQGSTGQSVGGLQCKNGKLHLTNPDLSKKLCIEGVGGVHVQNNVGEEVAVCRTDYPGTEAETVPLSLGQNDLQPLTCPDAQKYYHWQGKSTSAQYYVNPKGVSHKEGCQWGDGSKPIGNSAPINMGIGQNNGKWLSIFQNSPTTNAKLDFNIKIKGDNLSGSCKYEGGSFISESGTNDSGCTVEVMSGDATIVFYN